MTDCKRYSEPPEYLDFIGNKVVDAAFKVHKKWGPGLFEHFYQMALFEKLKNMDLMSKLKCICP